MRLSTVINGIAAAAITTLMAGAALAQQALEIIGQPVDGAMGFQPSATELKHDIVWLDTMINYIIGAIVIFVTGLLLYTVVRFNRRSNPTPARFTHNTPLEVVWTLLPIVILVFIGAFSLPILFKQQEIPVGDVTIKATGYQWYWGYEYVDEVKADGSSLSFESFLVDGAYKIDDEAAGWGDDQEMGTPMVLNEVAIKKLEYFGYTRDQFLLATDTAVVVPVGKNIVVQVTGADVIHSWKIPAFGVMQDAVPGRTAALWFNAEKEGIYFGQCSELCGQAHAYMPITVKVVSEAAYAEWLTKAKAGDVQLSSAATEPAEVKVASND
ncbi:MAG: cytochrome c oxidase subunit II [Paracoccaceae bacterium]